MKRFIILLLLLGHIHLYSFGQQSYSIVLNDLAPHIPVFTDVLPPHADAALLTWAENYPDEYFAIWNASKKGFKQGKEIEAVIRKNEEFFLVGELYSNAGWENIPTEGEDWSNLIQEIKTLRGKNKSLQVK